MKPLNIWMKDVRQVPRLGVDPARIARWFD